MTQCKQILKYMKENGGITQRQAEKFGCMRLASRIHDLKDLGYDIKTEMIKVKCRGGRTTKVARYSLE